MLISLEIWSGWLDLRYALLALVPLRSYPLEGAGHRWQLTDDLGTEYELFGSTSGAGRVVHLHQLSFQPAPPSEATTLTLTLDTYSHLLPTMHGDAAAAMDAILSA